LGSDGEPTIACAVSAPHAFTRLVWYGADGVSITEFQAWFSIQSQMTWR
jgi:hypothetical protein